MEPVPFRGILVDACYGVSRLLFTLVLFVAEPLVLHRWFHARTIAAPDAAFALLHWAHWLLLALSLITILGAVAGSQGMSFL